jgi:fibronectin-binding autotransporter adhesin
LESYRRFPREFGGGGGTVVNSNARAATLSLGGSSTTTFAGTIVNGSGTVALTLSGSGSQSLTGASTYSGATTISGGTLTVSGGGSLIGTLSLITQSGGAFILDTGTVTLASNTSGVFGVGYGATGTGTVTVNSGGVLNVGNGGDRTFIGGGPNIGPFGTGILNLEGGAMNVGAQGSNPNNKLYMNGYGGMGALNLDSGTLTTARPIQDGGNGSSVINFNGATIVCGFTGDLFDSCGTLNVRNGGMVIDTGSNTVTINQPIDQTSAVTMRPTADRPSLAPAP